VELVEPVAPALLVVLRSHGATLAAVLTVAPVIFRRLDFLRPAFIPASRSSGRDLLEDGVDLVW
jgi:hypothetical protein